MYDQLDRSSPVWDYLRSMKDLRVVVLRRNVVEAAVSFRIAMETNVWFVPNERSYIWYVPNRAAPPSPSLVYPLWYFDWFHNYYCSPEPFFIDLFSRHAMMAVDYDDLTSNWDHTIRAVQTHVGVDPIDIPMMFDKRTRGVIDHLIANYAEIKTHYADHPIPARHFEVAARPPEHRGRPA